MTDQLPGIPMGLGASGGEPGTPAAPSPARENERPPPGVPMGLPENPNQPRIGDRWSEFDKEGKPRPGGVRGFLRTSKWTIQDSSEALLDAEAWGDLWERLSGSGQKREMNMRGVTELAEAPARDFSAREQLDILLAHATTLDPEGIADIVVSSLDGATKGKDEHGNTMVFWRGKPYAINRPGMSGGDMASLIGGAVMFYPASRYANAGTGILGKTARGVAAGSLTSMGGDLVSQALGSKQQVDFTRALIAGSSLGISEVILSPGTIRMYRSMIGRKGLVRNGRMTRKGRRELLSAGIPEEQIDYLEKITDPDFKKLYAKHRVQGFTPEESARMAELSSMGIHATSRGQKTGNINYLTQEQMLAQGAVPGGQGTFQALAREQAQEMGESVLPGVARRVTGREPSVARAEEGATGFAQQAREEYQRQIRPAAQMLQEVRDEASGVPYLGQPTQLAMPSGGILNIPNASAPLKNMRDNILQELDQAAFRVDAPQIRGVMKEVDTLIDKADAGQMITFRDLIRAHDNMSDRLRSLDVTTPKNVGAIQAKDKLGEFIDDQVQQALFVGGDDILNKWKEARGLYRKIKNITSGKQKEAPYINRTLNQIIDSTDLTPEQIVNGLFAMGTKLGKNDATATVLGRLKQLVGQDSEAWGMLQEAAILRLTRSATGEVKSPTKLQNAIIRGLHNERSLYEVLFDEQGIKELVRTARTVGYLIPPREAMNPSQSAPKVFSLLKGGLVKLGKLGGLTVGTSVGGAVGAHTLAAAGLFGTGAERLTRRALGMVPGGTAAQAGLGKLQSIEAVMLPPNPKIRNPWMTAVLGRATMQGIESNFNQDVPQLRQGPQ